MGLALVPEGRQIFKSLTVEENLKLGARGRDGEASERMLERFPILRKRADQRADRLSGGEQQQLALARALVGEPKLLILDEPSFGLAPKVIDVIYQLLDGLREDGVTMLLVEQNAARTIAFCDRCLVLSGGLIRARGARAELEQDPSLLRAYLGRQL
jgi:ABC-type branched-subunit amino acid transport system ATPase component